MTSPHANPSRRRPATSLRLATLAILVASVAASAPPRSRRIMANAANSGAVPMNSVIAVGAPWYTSGTHMW